MLPKPSLTLDLIWSTTVSGVQIQKNLISIIHAHDTGPDNYCVRCLTITGFKHNIWSFRNLTRLLYPAKEDKVEDDADGNKEEVEVELEMQLEELYVVFGFRSISVLRYLTDHTGVLSLGVLARCPFCLFFGFMDSIYPFLGCFLKKLTQTIQVVAKVCLSPVLKMSVFCLLDWKNVIHESESELCNYFSPGLSEFTICRDF